MDGRKLEEARRAVAQARFLLVLTGAGISAESGVPTFRGPGGYWRNRHFSELASPEAFAREPRTVWDWYLERRCTVRLCTPNAAHEALAAWSKRATGSGGPPGALVTQNVDGLHERAGHAGVVRFHGSLWRNRCSACGREREDESLAWPELPVSPCCGAPERPGVVWFGEAIPTEAMDAAHEAMAQADAVLVIGTARVVYPAAGLVENARANGAAIVEVNPDEDYGIGELGAFGGIWLRAPAGAVVPALLAAPGTG
jgi:NAD-dependent deacetylase